MGCSYRIGVGVGFIFAAPSFPTVGAGGDPKVVQSKADYVPALPPRRTFVDAAGNRLVICW